jgi:hypothetical protein
MRRLSTSGWRALGMPPSRLPDSSCRDLTTIGASSKTLWSWVSGALRRRALARQPAAPADALMGASPASMLWFPRAAQGRPAFLAGPAHRLSHRRYLSAMAVRRRGPQRQPATGGGRPAVTGPWTGHPLPCSPPARAAHHDRPYGGPPTILSNLLIGKIRRGN